MMQICSPNISTRHQVRVVTKYRRLIRIKVHTYADEMATVALSKLLKRPIKFVADRIESFVTDIPPEITASRRSSASERWHVHRVGDRRPHRHRPLLGLSPHVRHRSQPSRQSHRRPATCPNYRARARVVFQNKNVMCQYRAVGHPM
jgi:carbon-monoxide dehydrogenase large subunit